MNGPVGEANTNVRTPDVPMCESMRVISDKLREAEATLLSMLSNYMGGPCRENESDSSVGCMQDQVNFMDTQAEKILGMVQKLNGLFFGGC